MPPPPGPPGPSDAGALPPPGQVRLSELLGALSHALDLTEGQPWGHAARSCLIGMRIGEALGLDGEAMSNLYYALLLKDAGCSSNAHAATTFFGTDDHRIKRELKRADWTDPLRLKLFALRIAAAGRGPLARVGQVFRMARSEPGTGAELIRIRCERGAQICRTLGFPPDTVEAVRSLDEHWDGAGEAEGLAGDRIPLLSRICLLTQTLEVFAAGEGWREALQLVRSRAGSWFDPGLIRALEGWADRPEWWAGLYGGEVLARVTAAEPPDRVVRVDSEGVDRVAEAFAEVVDAKTPFTARHSTRVASIAREVAFEMGFDPAGSRDLYRAGLLHDIGKLGISNRILDKNGPLTPQERRQVERHPVLTLTIVGQVEVFAGIARTAAVHHERLDGRGYPWGYGASELGRGERILAVADIHEALTAHRPYRSGMEVDRALGILREMRGSAVDGEVVEALEGCLERGVIPAPAPSI